MAGNPAPFSRFTERSARVIAAAGQLATADPVGARHMAAALLSEPEGLAGKAITGAGVTAEAVCQALGLGPAPQGPNVATGVLLGLSFDDSAKKALNGALQSALRLGHNYIGTEHLLLGLLFAGGPVSEAFSGLGLTPQRAEALIAAELAAYQAATGAN
jgi:ATP-dependent Clp protease ATP-binding subunit ClpC